MKQLKSKIIFWLIGLLILVGFQTYFHKNIVLKQNEQHQEVMQKLHAVDDHVVDNAIVGKIAMPYKSYAGKFSATFYCSCPICVGHKPIIKTASGNKPITNKTIAVDTSIIPLHSIVYIKDMGYYVAEDTGGHIKGKRIDIYVSNHQEALKLGKKTVEVYILQ